MLVEWDFSIPELKKRYNGMYENPGLIFKHLIISNMFVFDTHGVCT